MEKGRPSRVFKAAFAAANAMRCKNSHGDKFKAAFAAANTKHLRTLNPRTFKAAFAAANPHTTYLTLKL